MRPVHAKVKATGAAGSASLLLVFALEQAGVHLPPVESAALATLLSTAAGWVKRA